MCKSPTRVLERRSGSPAPPIGSGRGALRLRVLVTGANGFLGRHVVAALERAGHAVRALVRPESDASGLVAKTGFEILRADLRVGPDLAAALADVEVVVHLAAAMRGSHLDRYTQTTETTESLLAAMGGSAVRRLVLCSSFSVYDWCAAHGTVGEELALAADLDPDNRGYAAAKIRQEQLARHAARAPGWQLTILRPGFVWGPGNPLPAGSTGRNLGRLHLVFSPGRQLPFTYVENCADCFREAVESDRASGLALNVIDGFELTAWRFLAEALRRGGVRGLRVGVPYGPLLATVVGVRAVVRGLFGSKVRLPSLCDPVEFAQGYRPLRYSIRGLRDDLKWRPPLDLDECLRRTFGTGGSLG